MLPLAAAAASKEKGMRERERVRKAAPLSDVEVRIFWN